MNCVQVCKGREREGERGREREREGERLETVVVTEVRILVTTTDCFVNKNIFSLRQFANCQGLRLSLRAPALL